VSKNRIILGTVALGTAALVGLGSAAAFAATPGAGTTTLPGIQAKAAAAITLRVHDLNAAISKVNGTGLLGSSSASLASYLQADIAPLQALGTKIAGDTTVATAQADASTIFTSYRVLALVLPAARLAATADGIDATTIPDLTTLSAKAASHVNPSNRTAVQPLIDDLNAQIHSATNSTAGVATTLLGYTPSQWNANHDLLTASRGSVQAANGNITKARDDVRQIRRILTSTAPAPSTTPTTSA
jgi:hypothetical protein